MRRSNSFAQSSKAAGVDTYRWLFSSTKYFELYFKKQIYNTSNVHKSEGNSANENASKGISSNENALNKKMSSENAEEVLADPDLVMKLYMCPFCEGKLNSLEVADK